MGFKVKIMGSAGELYDDEYTNEKARCWVTDAGVLVIVDGLGSKVQYGIGMWHSVEEPEEPVPLGRGAAQV